ncbi:MAG TPA: condensation domain-containing protein, partial [Acidimicrobiia bacterium]|nr:condensation domain-containing protein [Acidimicrobiia bacterium]
MTHNRVHTESGPPTGHPGVAAPAIGSVWAEVLGLDAVAPEDDFFALGGDSLCALRAVTQIQEALGCQLDVSVLFEHPTFDEFVDAVIADAQAQATPALALEFEPADRDGDLPLSFPQLRLWTGQRQIGETPFYNVPCSYRLRGALDRDAMQRALDAIVERHEALRTCFPAAADGAAQQIIMAPAPVSMQEIDLRTEADPLAAARAWVASEARRPFAVETGPLLRTALLALADDDHVLALSMHHIVSDGSSMRVFGEELSALYGAFAAGSGSPLAPLALQYADFAAWQQRTFTDRVLAPHIEYWCDQLAGAETLELPVDRPRVLKRPYASGQFQFALSPEVVGGLRRIGRDENATLFMVLLAALQVTLSRTTGQTDISVGSPVANRNLAAAQKLIGFFVNTLVLRTDCDGNPTFTELVRRARRVAVDAYAHQDLPFDRIVDELQPRPQPGYNPLYQVHFQVVPMPLRDIKIGDLDAEFFESSSGATPLDLFVHCFESRDGVEGWVEFAADLFDEATIRRVLDHFAALCAAVAANPDCRVDDVVLGPPAAPLTGGAPVAGAPSVPALLEERAGGSPEVWAVTGGESHLTYAQLAHTARRIARRLSDNGVHPGVAVGVCGAATVDGVAAWFGALAAGARVVWLDPQDPPGWTSEVLAATGLRVVVATAATAHAVPAGPRVLVLDDGPQPREPLEAVTTTAIAMLAPTLTGEGVRAVPVDHATLTGNARALQQLFPLQPRDRVLHH